MPKVAPNIDLVFQSHGCRKIADLMKYLEITLDSIYYKNRLTKTIYITLMFSIRFTCTAIE